MGKLKRKKIEKRKDKYPFCEGLIGLTPDIFVNNVHYFVSVKRFVKKKFYWSAYWQTPFVILF